MRIAVSRQPSAVRIATNVLHICRVAALAKAWYGKKRAALTMRSKEIMLGHPVGSYVSSANDRNVAFPLNSVVTRVTWDFQKAETTIQTDYGELDFTARDHVPRTKN